MVTFEKIEGLAAARGREDFVAAGGQVRMKDSPDGWVIVDDQYFIEQTVHGMNRRAVW